MTMEPVLGTVIENPGASSTPLSPPLRKKRSSLSLETNESYEETLSKEGSEAEFSPCKLESVDEVIDEAIKDLQEPFYTPVSPPREKRRLTLRAYPVSTSPPTNIVPPPRPSSPSNSVVSTRPSSPTNSITPPTPSSPIPTTPTKSPPPRPVSPPSSPPSSPISGSAPDLPSSPIPPPPYNESNASLNIDSSCASPQLEKREGIFDKIFGRTGDANVEGGLQEEEIELERDPNSIENVPENQSCGMCLSMEQPKLEQIKKWTVQNYKFTKQLVSEKFGHSTKTVDKDLEDRIEELRLSKVQYGNMLREARVMFARFEALLTTHHNIRAQFQTLISHAPDLQDQLQASATTHSILEKNGEGLLGAIKTFVDSLNTLVNVTIQDTFLTIKNYENSRIEYDAYRNDIVTLQNAPQTEANKNRLLELQVIFENRKQKWEKLKRDTNTKLDLLGENRSMVMKTQLEMFNSAVIAYFSGNGDKLSEVLAEYHIKTKKSSEDGDATTNSFLARNE